MSNKIMTRESTQKGRFRCVVNGLRLVVSLLLLVVASVADLRAATINFNLPNGYYYLGNQAGDNGIPDYDGDDFTANFYMCPVYSTNVVAKNYLDGDKDKPLITSFKSFSDSNKNQGKTYSWAVWYIEAATGDNAGYFYIKHRDTEQYLIANDNSSPAANRRRINLGPKSKENDCLFRIQSDNNGGTYYISSKTKSASNNNKYLNPSNGNKDYLYATSDNSDTGGIFGFYNTTTTNSAWHFVQVPCETPVITFDNTNHKVTISGVDGANFYYTLDNSDPSSGSTLYGEPFEVTGNITIKAIAAKSGYANSEIASVRIVLTPTITLAQTEYTYNGSSIEPEVTSVMDGTTPIDVNEYTVSYTDYTDAGTAHVNIEDKAGDNLIVYGSKDFTINPKALAITAEAKSKYYGDTDPELTYTSDGLVGNDAITGELSRETGETIGTYAINQNTLTAGNNYTITFIGDNLTINKRNLTITADSDTKVYDGTALTKDSYTNTELAAGDQIESVTVTGSQTDAGSSDNVPSAAVIMKGETDVIANYNITYANGTLEVTKKTLTITADAKSKLYGEDDPELTYTSEGLINDDAITGALTRVAGENAGDYAINQGSLTASNNYAISFIAGTLTINPKIVKDNPNTEDGESAINIVLTDIPTGNYTYDGTAKTPTITVKDGDTVLPESEYTKTITNNINAGTNTAIVTITDKEGGNYIVSGTATFTINPAALTITPNDNQRKYYSNPDPVLTYTNVGLVEGDVLTGALSREEGENVGDYEITQGTIDNSHNPNYAITFTTGKTFVIAPKSLGDGTNPAQNITIEITDANVDHVVVMHGSKLLREGTNDDYSISVEGNATTKYYKVTINGRNNYEGSFKATFANLVLSKRFGSPEPGGAATFVSNTGDGNFVVPDDMSAYIVTGINNSAGTVEVEQLDNIPEGVPVLLLSTVNTNGFIVKTKEGGTAPQGTNLLKVDDADKDVSTGEIYVLYKGEFVLNAKGILPAGKIYLERTGGSQAPARLTIDWGVANGIEEIPFSEPDMQRPDTWYTLEGIKLNGSPAKRGLYLKNGKKTIVK